MGKVQRQREVRDQLEKQVEDVRLRKEKEAVAVEEEQNRNQIEAERMEEALKKREAEDRERVEEFYAKLEREAILKGWKKLSRKEKLKTASEWRNSMQSLKG